MELDPCARTDCGAEGTRDLIYFLWAPKNIIHGYSWIKYLVQTAVALSGTSLCELGHRNGKHRRGAPVVGWLSTGWCRSLVGGAETWLINCWLMVNDCQCCSNLVVNGFFFFFGCFFRDGYNCIHLYQFVSISHLNQRASCIVQDGSAAAKIKPKRWATKHRKNDAQVLLLCQLNIWRQGTLKSNINSYIL